MKKGDSITCPHCGKESHVKVRSEMDGWTKVGEVFACALCDASLGDVGGETEKMPKPKKSAAALEDFLGTSKEEVREVIEDDGYRAFCKDCKHLLEHPFKIYCMLHKKDVDPMDDCPDFIAGEK